MGPQEIIDNLFAGKLNVADLDDEKFAMLLHGLRSLYIAKVMNCVDATGKSDNEWLTLSSVFDRILTKGFK